MSDSVPRPSGSGVRDAPATPPGSSDFHFGHDPLGRCSGWVNVERGGEVTADEVIAALQADVKMLRDHQRNLRVVVFAVAYLAAAAFIATVSLWSRVLP